MTADAAALKELLAAAEVEITTLRGNVEEYAGAFDQMMAAQSELEMQIMDIMAQRDKLEDLLFKSDEGLSESMIVIRAMRAAITKLHADSVAAAEQAKVAAAKVELAAGMFDLASKTELAEEREMLDEYERQITELRKRLTRR